MGANIWEVDKRTHIVTDLGPLFSASNNLSYATTEGWYFSIELLVKTHRLRWKIGEVPSQWYERTAGQSRFRVFKWLPGYLRWYFYSFATTWLFRGPGAVKTREPVAEPKAR